MIFRGREEPALRVRPCPFHSRMNDSLFVDGFHDSFWKGFEKLSFFMLEYMYNTYIYI